MANMLTNHISETARINQHFRFYINVIVIVIVALLSPLGEICFGHENITCSHIAHHKTQNTHKEEKNLNQCS